MTSDWDQRQLCPDGSCVGVIGPDGTCKVCGRAAPNWGDERRRGRRNTDEVEPVAEPAPPPQTSPPPPSADGDDDFENRKLCPDGACIGVIGANGKCNVCGKSP